MTYLMVGFLVFFVAFRPENASAVAHRIMAMLSAIADGFSQFVGSLVQITA